MTQPTQSTYWHQTGITRLIHAARHSPTSMNELIEVVYQPAVTRIRKFMNHDNYESLNLEEREIFVETWLRKVRSALKSVDFNDRQHFMNLVMLRCRESARVAAKRQRARWRQEFALNAEVTGGGNLQGSEKLLEAEQIAIALQSLEAIDLPIREAIYYQIIEGRTLRETSEILGIAASTVHERVKRGLVLLREDLS